MNEGEPVGYDQDGHVVTITYNRPDKLNAVNGAMREGLNDAWQRFLADPDAWVAIVTGAGRAFCAGADLVDGAGSVGTFPGTFWEKPTVNSFESGLELFKPVIAAVNGPCIGYGLTAVTFCDFVIASDRATFAFPEVADRYAHHRRRHPSPPTAELGRCHGVAAAGRSGRRRAGPGRWDSSGGSSPTTTSWPRPASSPTDSAPSAPLATRATKEVAVRTADMGWTEAVRFGETMRLVANATDDARIGREATRAEREPPTWTGR